MENITYKRQAKTKKAVTAKKDGPTEVIKIDYNIYKSCPFLLEK